MRDASDWGPRSFVSGVQSDIRARPGHIVEALVRHQASPVHTLAL